MTRNFSGTFVLKDIDLEISEGEFVTIMGPSGAGKSTLLNIIGMLDEPNEGEYLFLDQPAHSINERKKNGISQELYWVYLPGISPDRRNDCL